MSDLPSGWVQVALGTVIQPKNERLSPTEAPEAKYLGLEHVEAHTNAILGTVPASAMTSSSVTFVAGDVLYGRMRPYLNKVVRPNFDGLASAEFIVFPASVGVDSDFLLRRISATDFVQFACSQYEGDRPRVKFDQLGNFSLGLPSRAEQTRIVAKLEELLSDLDAGVAELKAAQRKLKQYRQSLLKAAVEGALTAEWRARNKPTETGAQLLHRILSERRARWEAKQLTKFKEQGKTPPKDWQKKYPEPVQPDTSDLPALPEGWVWASVDQLSPGDLTNGRSVPTAQAGAKVLRLTAVKEGRIDLREFKVGAWSEEDAKSFAVVEGDLLIVRGNGSLTLVGRAGLVGHVVDQVAYPDTMIRLRVMDSVVSSSWVGLVWDSYLVRTHLERRARTSAGIYKIAQPDIAIAPVPVPGVAEQARIRELFQQQLEQIIAMQTMLEAGLRHSAAQRQNILRAAFAGQLVPQDANDEPASVLLERIRAERAAQAAVKPRGRKTRERA